jgi:hypothetical protein
MLIVEHDNLKTRCRVIWRKPNRLGVEFIAEQLTPDAAAGEKQPA